METKFSRVTLEAPAVENSVIDPLQEELAKKAKNLLGYGLLQERIQGELATETQRCVKLAGLANTFKELDIQPLNQKEVERYQRKQQRTLNRKSFFALPRYAQLFVLLEAAMEKLSSIIFGVFGVTPAKDPDSAHFSKEEGRIYMALFLSAMFGTATDIGAILTLHWRWAIGLSPCSILLFAVFYCIIFDKRVQELKLRVWSWTKLTFAECYQRKIEIREFALDTATRIKEKLPEADLFVEVVISTDLQFGDPFLCLQHAGAKYYLEVWDESRFERRMLRKA